MKKISVVLMTVILIFSFASCADTTVKGSVVRESTFGNAELDIMPQKLLEKVNIGDTVVVVIGDFNKEMLFVDELIEEDGKLQLFYDEEDHNINICIYNQPFCETYSIKIGEKVKIKKNN